GTITFGSGTEQENLELQNIIAGLGLNPADLLTGTFDTSLVGTPFAFGGSTSIGDLAANSSDASDFDITFDTDATTGGFTATAVIDEYSHNSSQSDLALSPYTLTIEGTVIPVGTPSVPDSGATGLLLGLGLIGLALMGRRLRLTA
ncbi:MAG: VPDSG-CTERM sorting domain-containing protein, partial [Opitutaceae bacterium]